MDRRRSLAVRVRSLASLATTPLSLVIAAASVAAFAFVEVHGASTDPATLVRFGALERGRVWSGEAWRLVTAAFLHAGPVHLAWNTVCGFLACRLVERALGAVGLLVVYVASAMGASALSLIGQDAVAAGSSGALFGVLGAILALHRRGVGSWPAFFRSRATQWMLGGSAALTLVAPLFAQLDHLAHAGGLATGAVAAWLLSEPRRRAIPWAVFATGLAALVIAAAWPRETMSRFEAEELEARLHAALRATDVPAARRLVARADARRHDSERLRYYRALLLVQEGDLEGAIAIARALRDARDPGLRPEAARIARGVARTLGYRHYTGDGAARDPLLGLAYIEEACALGDEESCRDARAISGR